MKILSIRNSGIRNVQFLNWSTTYGCIPELFFAPKTIDEIRQILILAQEERRKIRLVGRGHSPSDIVCTQDYMISLQHMNNLLDVDRANHIVKVEAGMTVQELNEIHLPKHGLALKVLGSISDITIAGMVSTGTHGTGINFGILSSYVLEMEIMTSLGDVVVCSPTLNKDVFKAAAVGLGAMGVILSLTLQCEPAFRLELRQYASNLREVIEHIDVHLNCSNHFQFLWFPHTDNVLLSHINRTDKAITRKTRIMQWKDWIWDYAIGYYCLEFFYYASTYFPKLIPFINKGFFWLLHSDSKTTVDVSYKIFNRECLFKQYVNEWAIPVEKMGLALWKLQEIIENTPNLYVHFPVEVRFAKGDDLFISPANGRNTCFINIIMYRPYNKLVPYDRYWEEYESLMLELGGRPHWAKASNITGQQFYNMYPHFASWCKLRRQQDPQDLFLNPYMERVLKG